MVTLTTVGYGDKVPVTWLGKVISGFFILFGVAVFALPAGIIGAGLALKLEEVERSRQRRMKKEAAAKMIQRAWKCYRANHAYFELSLFFRHQPGDLFKVRVYDSISRAFIAMVRFHIAKNSFKEITRPVDLRNVIESYKYGQMDIFGRLKQLNSALDIIISRMSVAENERVVAINQLARKLEEIEQQSESTKSGLAISKSTTKSNGIFHFATENTGSLDTALGTSTGTGMRYLDLVHIPPMPQTNTHPSTIPLRTRPHSASSHQFGSHLHGSHHGHHSSQHHPRPYSTPNYYPHNRQHNSSSLMNHSDHTITTIDEVTHNGEEAHHNNNPTNNSNTQKLTDKFNSNSSSISFVIEDYSNKPNHSNNSNKHLSDNSHLMVRQRQRQRSHSQ